MTDLGFLDLSKPLHSGKMSPVEVTEAALGRIVTLDDTLMRFTCLFDASGSPTMTMPCGFTPRRLAGRLPARRLHRG